MYISNFEEQSFESLTFMNTEVHQMKATLNWLELITTIVCTFGWNLSLQSYVHLVGTYHYNCMYIWLELITTIVCTFGWNLSLQLYVHLVGTYHYNCKCI